MDHFLLLCNQKYADNINCYLITIDAYCKNSLLKNGFVKFLILFKYQFIKSFLLNFIIKIEIKTKHF